MSRTPTVPSSCTAVKPARSRRRSWLRGAVGGAGAVPVATSTPGTPAEYAATPAIATVRLVHTRADGRCATNDAVVQANQCAAPSVEMATSAAPAVRSPRRYMPQTPIGSRPAASAGVDRAST
jgi:hypothetical protein